MAQIFIRIDKDFYFAGDTVYGEVFLNLYENMNANEVLIKFKGWESVKWIEERDIIGEEERGRVENHLVWDREIKVRTDTSDSSSDGEDETIKYKYVRYQGDRIKQITRHSGGKLIAKSVNCLHNFGGQYIPAGQYVFPFSFKTMENYPASFCDRDPHGKHKGRIKYEMRVFVRGYNTRRRLMKHRTEIIIRETAVIKNEKQEMEAHVKSCCCIDKGVSKIQCYFEKNGYSPGEQARIYCILDNKASQADITRVTVKLINNVTYTSNQRQQLKFSKTLFTNTFPGLNAGEEVERDKTVMILNESNKNMDKRDIMPTSRGERLQSVYSLRVESELDAPCTCCSDLPIVNQPIMIYPYIPVNYNFQAPQNWDPTTMPVVNLEQAIYGQNQKLVSMENPYY